MKTILAHKFICRLAQRTAAVGAVVLVLGACNLNSQVNPAEGIGFREARFAEISAMRDYRRCRDEALELDTQARTTGSPGRYLASARLIEKCEADVGSVIAGVAKEERMRAYALSIQNHVKGGDIESAAANFERFKKAFPGKDLYYADGSSYIETMEALLGSKELSDFGRFSVLNVSAALKSEIRRARHWKHN